MWRVLHRFGALARRLPWRTFGLAGLAVALFATAGPAADALVYDRVAIAQGQLWRLLTGHWVHSDTTHLTWNLIAFVLLGGIVESRRGAWLWSGLLAGTFAVDLLLWLGLLDVARYCGLSGALNTLLVLALLIAWRDTDRPVVVAIGIGSLLKIGIESYCGQALWTQTAWASVPLAHLAGWLAGACLVVMASLAASRAASVARSHHERPSRSSAATFSVRLGPAQRTP